MLGTFEHYSMGRFVVSGKTPEDFLWDLFDQLVLHGSASLEMGGLDILLPDPDGVTSDSGEREAFRGTPEWATSHSDFFVALIVGEAPAEHIPLPTERFFKLHCARLVQLVASESFDGDEYSATITQLMRQHGHGTPEYLAALNEMPSYGYPQATYEAAPVINYLMHGGILTLNHLGDGATHGIRTQEAADALRHAETEARRKKVEAYKEGVLETYRQYKASRQAGKKKKAPKE